MHSDVQRGGQVLWLPFKSLALHLAPERPDLLVARRKPGAAEDVVAEVPWQATALLGLVGAGGVAAPIRWLRADLRRSGAGRRGACFGLAEDVRVAWTELVLFLPWCSWRVCVVGSIQDVVQRGRVPFAACVALPVAHAEVGGARLPGAHIVAPLVVDLGVDLVRVRVRVGVGVGVGVRVRVRGRGRGRGRVGLISV